MSTDKAELAAAHGPTLTDDQRADLAALMALAYTPGGIRYTSAMNRILLAMEAAGFRIVPPHPALKESTP